MSYDYINYINCINCILIFQSVIEQYNYKGKGLFLTCINLY